MESKNKQKPPTSTASPQEAPFIVNLSKALAFSGSDQTTPITTKPRPSLIEVRETPNELVRSSGRAKARVSKVREGGHQKKQSILRIEKLAEF